jgi:hypothetical protein
MAQARQGLGGGVVVEVASGLLCFVFRSSVSRCPLLSPTHQAPLIQPWTKKKQTSYLLNLYINSRIMGYEFHVIKYPNNLVQ